jgi:chromate reductase, NAD(P)H dehydrogenase (quinone)
MASPRILVFAGSIRTGAFSGKLAAAVAKELARNDADVTLISLADYPLPIYNADLEKEQGVPENAKKLARQIASHQGVFIATPEYNNSLPPLLKNAIDWVSRIGDDEIKYRHRVFACGSSSPGPFGGARALIDLRKVVLNALGAIIIPYKIEVVRAGEAFDEAGNLVPEPAIKTLRTVSKHLVAFAGRLVD